jgi:uncharacterized protein (TIGR02270 family)
VVRSPAVTFDVLCRFDERLSQLVDKLSEWPVLAERFLQHEPPAFKHGLVFVTAVVALRGGASRVFDELLTQLESDPELLPPIASALGWLEYGEVRSHIGRLLEASSPALLQLALAAATAHRVDPGLALDRALDANRSPLRASALEAIGRLALSNLQPRLRAALSDEDVTCRFWAAWSAVRLGDHAGVAVLGRLVSECGVFARPACDMALRALDPDRGVRAHSRLLSVDKRLAVLAAGIVGDCRLVPWLLDLMESDPLAGAAGAAFSLMTGRDLRRHDLDAGPYDLARTEVSADASESQPTSVRPNQQESEESLGDEVNADLVRPDAVKVRKWWDENRHTFAPRVRYLAGVPVRPSELMNILRAGDQRQREAAALEYALLHPDAPMINVMAPAHRQIGTLHRDLQ